jgi:hypothetical protein
MSIGIGFGDNFPFTIGVTEESAFGLNSVSAFKPVPQSSSFKWKMENDFRFFWGVAFSANRTNRLDE